MKNTMNLFKKRSVRILASSLALLFTSSSNCYATLGKTPSEYLNSNTIRSQSLASTFNKKASTFSVRTSVLNNGTEVREYFGSDNVVFAVSWKGPFLPDFNELLGNNFSLLKEESNRLPKAGRGQILVSQSDVAIESTGRMRAFQGRAWIRTKLAAVGLTQENIE